MKLQKDSIRTVIFVSLLGISIILLSYFFVPWAWLKWTLIAIGTFMTWFIIFFFRVPFREMPQGEGLVCSVADGEVVYAGENGAFGNCVEIKHIINGEEMIDGRDGLALLCYRCYL